MRRLLQDTGLRSRGRDGPRCGGMFGRGAESCLLKLVYVTPLSAPFGSFNPWLRLLCDVGTVGMGRGFDEEAPCPSFLGTPLRPWRPLSNVIHLHHASGFPRKPENAAWRHPATLYASQARPARNQGVWGHVGPTSRRVSQSPEGNHFHTDPDAQGLRPPSTTGTGPGPVSPARLPVYPRRNVQS